MNFKKFAIVACSFIIVILATMITLGCVKVNSKLDIDEPKTFIYYDNSTVGIKKSSDEPKIYNNLKKYVSEMTDLSIFDYMAKGISLKAKPGQDYDNQYKYSYKMKEKGICLEMQFEKTQSIVVEIDGNTVKFADRGRGIDIGAVGKGMAANSAASALKEADVGEAIINLGGNVCVIGDKNGEKYKIGIRDPQSDGLLGYVTVGNTSVVTSGVYERNFEYEGKVYHHILDTSTGYPADNGLLSVTVVCDDPVAADALSTAFFVTGKNSAEDLFEKFS